MSEAFTELYSFINSMKINSMQCHGTCFGRHVCIVKASVFKEIPHYVIWRLSPNHLHLIINSILNSQVDLVNLPNMANLIWTSSSQTYRYFNRKNYFHFFTQHFNLEANSIVCISFIQLTTFYAPSPFYPGRKLNQSRVCSFEFRSIIDFSQQRIQSLIMNKFNKWRQNLWFADFIQILVENNFK